MKKLLLILTLFCLVNYSLTAQDKVKEKALKGEWKMVFDIDEEDLEKEIEEESWFGWMVASSVSEFVADLMDEIDIRMEFEDGGDLKITVYAFGEKEVEGAVWYINRDGELIITDEGDDDDEDEVWMFVEENLVLFEKSRSGRLEDKPVYMVRR